MFSLQTICHVDRIVSRPAEDVASSMLKINSTFLVSFEFTSNGNTISRQQFEEWSVPILRRPDMVSSITCQGHRFVLQ